MSLIYFPISFDFPSKIGKGKQMSLLPPPPSLSLSLSLSLSFSALVTSVLKVNVRV